MYVFGASLTLGGIVGAHVMLETARDALFLANIPPQSLAFVYLGIALFGFVVSRYDGSVTRMLGRTNALVLALMVSAIGTMMFYLAKPVWWLNYALYIWAGVVGTVLTLQFWLFVATRFTTAQGRRLYGLIAAGGVLGAVLGGLLSTFYTRAFGVEGLLVIAAGLQLLTALLVTTAPEPKSVSTRSKPMPMRESMRALRNSPYLVRVGVMTGLATFTLLMTDYLFKSVTASEVPSDQLGPFLAIYYTVLNAIALVVQVFIAMRVLQRAGTIFSLMLLPTLLLFGGGATLALGPILWLVLIAKGADGALRHSLHRVSNELLFLPIPSEQRSVAKPVLDTAVSRGTQGLGALAILLLTRLDIGSPRVVGGIVVAGALVWVGTALSLRGPYKDQFRKSLARPQSDPDFDVNQLNLDGIEVILEALSSPDENRVLGAIGVLDSASRTGLIPALVLYHPSPKVLQRALEVIPQSDRKDWVPLAERLVNHEDSGVRSSAVRALGNHGHLDLVDPSKFDDAVLQATAAFFQADRRSKPEQHPHVARLLVPEGNSDAQRALLRVIGEYGNRNWAQVILALDRVMAHGDAALLANAMARAKDPRFLPGLIARLGHRDGRDEVRQALVALGDQGLAALADALYDPDTPGHVRLHLPRAISRFETRAAADLLLDVIEGNLPGAVRYKALRGLGRIAESTKMRFSASRILPIVEHNAQEFLRLGVLRAIMDGALANAEQHALPAGTLLTSLLADKQNQSTERITRLLALLHPNEDLRRVYHALGSEDSAAKSAAGELIEVLTLGYDEDLRELLRAMSDPLPIEERVPRLTELLDLDLETDVDALRELLADPDPPLSALAAEFALQQEVLEVAVEVEEVRHSNPWLSMTPSTPERARAKS